MKLKVGHWSVERKCQRPAVCRKLEEIKVKLKYTPQDATISILHDNMLSSPYGTIIILH